MAVLTVRLDRGALRRRPVPAVGRSRGRHARLHDDLPRVHDEQTGRVCLSLDRHRADAARSAGGRGRHGPSAQLQQMVHVLANVRHDNGL